MYKVKKMGYVCTHTKGIVIRKNSSFVHESKNWVIWRTTITLNTCEYCFLYNGKILSIRSLNAVSLPVHPNCKCRLDPLPVIYAGSATKLGGDGVDAYVADNGVLPQNYLTKEDAWRLGWVGREGNLADVLPGKLIGGNQYFNWDGRLPSSPGRVWFEADFDYTGGFRNDCRLLFSSDGLLFVTYDHYLTFYEIEIGGTT